MHWDRAEDDWYMDHVVIARDAGETVRQTRWRLLARHLAESGPLGLLASRQGFVVTPAQAIRSGISSPELRRRIRRGEWGRPRRGVIIPFRAEPEDAAVLAISGAALVRTGVTVSHLSGARLRDLPTGPCAPLIRLPVEFTTTTSGHFRRRDGLIVSTSRLPPHHVDSWFGVPVTSVPRTVVDIARRNRVRGLIAADSALFRDLTSLDALGTVLGEARNQIGVAQARAVLELASPLRESPLESVTALLIHDAGLPSPEWQAWIVDPGNGQRFRVDGLWRERRVILEADGRVKYTDRELWKEKLRQEQLEQLGFRVVRVRWAEVMRAASTTVGRMHNALSLGGHAPSDDAPPTAFG